MQVILPDEQIHQIQLLISDLIKQEIENRLNNSNLESPFLNKQQTCDYLGISNNTLDTWINKGLPIIRVGKTVRFDRFELTKWMHKQQQFYLGLVIIKPRYFSSSIHKENTMSITKTKDGTYRLRVYIPEEAKTSLGIDKNQSYKIKSIEY